MLKKAAAVMFIILACFFLPLFAQYETGKAETPDSPYAFDLNSAAAAHSNIVVSCEELQGVTFLGITGLEENADYLVSATDVIIKESFLATLSVGIHDITLNFSASTQKTVSVDVVDTTPVCSVSPVSAVFNRTETSPQHTDLVFTLSMAYTEFSGIQGLSAEDYTKDANEVTVSKEALSRLLPGENTLVFNFTSGGSRSVAIMVSDDSITASISPDNAVFDYAAPGDVLIAVSTTGCSLTGVEGLTEGRDYSLEGDNVVLLKAYLETLKPGQYTLYFQFDYYSAQALSLQLVETSPVASLLPQSATFDKYVNDPRHADISVAMTANGHVFSGIAGLEAGSDYTVSGDTVTISKDSLNAMENGTHTFPFQFDGHRYALFDVEILNSEPAFTINEAALADGSGAGWSYADGVLAISGSGLTLSGYSGDALRIEVAAAVTDVALSGVDLEDCNFVYAGGPTGTLLISMQGSNEMHGGIEGVNGNLTFGGSGSLKVVSGQEAAVWAGKITVRSGSLTALAVSGGSTDAYGLRAMSTLMISGGTVVAGGSSGNGYAYGIMADSFITTAGTVASTGAVRSGNSRGYAHGIMAGSISITGGTIAATGDGSAGSGNYGYGMHGRNIFIDGGSVTANGVGSNGGGFGIYSYETATYANGTVHATGNSEGISFLGDVSVLGGSVTASGDYGGLESQNGRVKISGGSLTTTGDGWGISTQAGDILFDGGTFDSSGGVFSRSGKIAVSAGSMKLRDSVVMANKGAIEISGGEVVAESFAAYEGDVRITGGDVTLNGEGNCIDSYSGNISVSGGKLTARSRWDGSYALLARDGQIDISGGNIKACGGRGIAASDGVSLSGADTYVRAAGSISAFGVLTVNGHLEDVTGWRHGVYENGTLRKIDTPKNLYIDGETYDAADLSEDLEGDGWRWSWEAPELLLDGYSGGFVGCADASPFRLRLKDGTANSVSGEIDAPSLDISGGGSLRADVLAVPNGSISIHNSAVLVRGHTAASLDLTGALLFTGTDHVYTLERDAVLTQSLHLPEGNTYIVPAGRSIQVEEGASLYVAGVLVKDGTITGTLLDGNGNPFKVSAVTVQPETANLYVGDTLPLAVGVTPNYAEDQSVTWSSDDETVAEVDNSGVVTALKAGSATISATAADGNDVSAGCQITVMQYANGMTLDKAGAAMYTGETLTLHATISPDGTNPNVTWTSNDGAVAAVSSSGVVSALKAGTATITATTVDGSNKSASCQITVKQYATGVALYKTSATMYTGGKLRMQATVSPSDTSDKSLTWSSSDTAVATVANGLVTAIKAGNVTITATTADGSNKSVACEITVWVLETGVTIGPVREALLKPGDILMLSANVQPEDAHDRSVIWGTSNPDVALVDGGMVTAVGRGTATITAVTPNYVTATCEITVEDRMVDLTLSVPDGTPLVNGAYRVPVNGTLQIGTSVKPQGIGHTLSYKTSDGKVASVKSGVIKGLKNGQATITVTAKDSKGLASKSKTLKISVYTPVGSVTLPGEAQMLTGAAKKLTAAIAPSGASDKALAWDSDNKAVATVAQDGTVTARKMGTANITATSANGKAASCLVRVTDRATGVQIASETGNAYVDYKKSLQLSAAVSPETAYGKVTWKSSNTAYVTVDANGRVYGKKVGKATVYATAADGSGVRGQITIQVITPVKDVRLPETDKVFVGRTKKLAATLSPSKPTFKSLKWESNNEAVATVAADGTVTAKALGTAVITATAYNALSDSCTVTVAQPVTGITITPPKNGTVVYKGETTEALEAVVAPGNANDKSLAWKSSNTKLAAVDAQGQVTGRSAGKVKITATAKDGSGVAGSISLTIVSPATSIKLNKTGVVLYQNGTGAQKALQLTATPSPKGSKYRSLTWSVASGDAATVDASTGIVTAVKYGAAVIRATTDRGRTADCTVTVRTLPAAFNLKTTEKTLAFRQSFNLGAETDYDAGCTERALTWKSSNTKVATVSSTGVVKASKSKTGTAVITATTKNGIKASCTVKVVKSLPKGTAGTPAVEAAIPRIALRLTGGGYATSDGHVADVDGKGNVELKSDGAATLEAGGKQIVVKVEDGNLAELKLDKDTGLTISTNTNVKWTVKDREIAAIDEEGQLAALRLGTTTLTCDASDGGEWTIRIVVTQPDEDAPRQNPEPSAVPEPVMPEPTPETEPTVAPEPTPAPVPAVEPEPAPSAEPEPAPETEREPAPESHVKPSPAPADADAQAGTEG